MQRVLLKIPRLAARVLVTDRSTGIEICTMKGTETRAWEPLQVTGSPPGGVKDAKAKSEPKRSDPRQRAHHCTSVAVFIVGIKLLFQNKNARPVNTVYTCTDADMW